MNSILLSFDIEEFDMPLEYGQRISPDDQITISQSGTTCILDLLKKHQVQATFFSTVIFARHSPELLARIKNEGHELASHSYYHSKFQPEDLQRSKDALEKLSGDVVNGFRMPRMMPVDHAALRKAGYVYNSSINPTYLPGRYNNLSKPRTLFTEDGLVQLPSSVTPLFRFPLFWISFHNVPSAIYNAMCRRTIRHDGYLNLYFHPWEFTDITKKEFGFPGYVSKNSGAAMIRRFDAWLTAMKNEAYQFTTISRFLFLVR